MTVPEKAADVIDWVGDDPDRATEARQAEQDRDTPRKTVMGHVDGVLAPPTPEPGTSWTFRNKATGEERSPKPYSTAARILDRSPRWERL